MSDELVRFSVAVPDDLLARFDQLVSKRGSSSNRSEAIRDLIRAALEKDECEDPQAQVVGTLTIAYNHHTNDLKDRLDEIQHSHFENVVSTLHIHLDPHNCLETIILKGTMETVQAIADHILGMKGVKTGELTCMTVAVDHGHHHTHLHE